MVAFELVRSSSIPNTTANGGGLDRKRFTYPKSIYLDQFLRENIELAQQKREQREEMFNQVQQLVKHKKTLTHFDVSLRLPGGQCSDCLIVVWRQDKDTLKDLRSAIFYFENVADAKDDLERRASVQVTTRKLQDILATIEEEIKGLDFFCFQGS